MYGEEVEMEVCLCVCVTEGGGSVWPSGKKSTFAHQSY